MKYYELVQSLDVDGLARFIDEMIQIRENEIFVSLHRQGLNIDRITLAPEIRVMQYKKLLMKEVKD